MIAAIGGDGRPAGEHLAINGRSLDVHRVSIERRLTGLVEANGLNQVVVVVVERHMPLALLRLRLDGHALRRRVIGNSGRRGHSNKRGDSCRAGNCLLHKTHLGILKFALVFPKQTPSIAWYCQLPSSQETSKEKYTPPHRRQFNTGAVGMACQSESFSTAAHSPLIHPFHPLAPTCDCRQ